MKLLPSSRKAWIRAVIVVLNGIVPAAFVRHFEEAAKIILSESSLPSLPGGYDPRSLAIEMESQKQIAGLPAFDDAAFEIPSSARGDAIRDAFDAIAPMFWGPRIPLEETCYTISSWIRRSLQ